MKIYKEIKICSNHQLKLPYDSPCNNLHGHNYRIEVWITGKIIEHGMLIDFGHIKKIVNEYDHNNKILNITAEEFAQELAARIMKKCMSASKIKVRVWETDTCYAEETLIKY